MVKLGDEAGEVRELVCASAEHSQPWQVIELTRELVEAVVRDREGLQLVEGGAADGSASYDGDGEVGEGVVVED
eukprot:CAMPEP_0169478488 /NCGR_PEP_ID=MMETSP1042-20121227/28495_1 /TAXON_ID=464988 /ORGANISM="Hemiselmis andersenii, Strain CCMP1180" /LENGTH=73 /DNA_ID=CAMNT_0009592945 /DNA_START=286 /DNA_END=507 /DNA_ORIENTATION=-